MITDEQRKAFEQWYMAQFGDKDMQTTESGNYFYVRHAAAWKSWQAAQQVKPLEFERDEFGCLSAESQFGDYEIFNYGQRYGGYEGYSFEGPDRISKVVKTEVEAIAAANQDYQRRVLSCLVHGGV